MARHHGGVVDDGWVDGRGIARVAVASASPLSPLAS